MAEPKEGVLDPESIFDEGFISGRETATEALQEQINEQLSEMGLTEGEITALYDPAPRRKGKHRRGKIHCSKRQRETMPQICKGSARRYDPGPRRAKHRTWGRVASHYRRTFDPEPLRERVKAKARHYGKKGKDLMSKLVKNEMAVGGVAGVGTFLALYSQRAGVLKTAGAKLKDGTAVDGMLNAMQYDFEQFSTNGGIGAIPTRLQAAWKPILGYGLGGLIVRNVVADYVPKQYKKLAVVIGDVAMGIAGGYALKAGLDEPDSNTNLPPTSPTVMAPGSIRVVSQPAPQVSTPAYGVVNRY